MDVKFSLGWVSRAFARSASFVIAAPLLALALLAIGPTFAASAHSELISTSPGAGAVLTQPPKEISLTFNEGVHAVRGGMRLVRQDGLDISLDQISSVQNGLKVVTPSLQQGAYVFAWRVVSADGHPVRGAFTFQIGATGNQSTAAGLAHKLLAGPTKNPVSGFAFNLARLARLLCTFVIIGTLALGSRAPKGRFLRLFCWAAVAAELALLLLYGPFITGRAISQVADGVLFDDTLHSTVGKVAVVRIVLLSVLAVAGSKLALQSSHPPSASRPAFALPVSVVWAAVGLVLAATVLVPGHATVGRWMPWAFLLSIVHVLGAAAWIGCLLALSLSTRWASTEGGDISLERARQLSRLATIGIFTTAASGAFAVARQAGSIPAVTQTTYGRALLVKLGLFALVALFGYRNRQFLGKLSNSQDNQKPVSWQAFSNGTRAESIAAIALICATVVLGSLQPGRDALALPVSKSVSSPIGLIEVTISPAKSGRNQIHIYTLKNDGSQLPVKSIGVDASLPAKGIENLVLVANRAGTNHFVVQEANLPVPGNWTLNLAARVDEFDETRVVVNFKVR